MLKSISGCCERSGRPLRRLHVRARLAANIEDDLRRRTLLVHRHRTTGRTGHESGRGGRDEGNRFARARPTAEQPHRVGSTEVASTRRESGPDMQRGRRFGVENRLRAQRRSGPVRADDRRVGTSRGVEYDQLAELSPLAVDHRHLVSGVKGHGARAAPRNRVPFDVRRKHGNSRNKHRAPLSG